MSGQRFISGRGRVDHDGDGAGGPGRHPRWPVTFDANPFVDSVDHDRLAAFALAFDPPDPAVQLTRGVRVDPRHR